MRGEFWNELENEMKNSRHQETRKMRRSGVAAAVLMRRSSVAAAVLHIGVVSAFQPPSPGIVRPFQCWVNSVCLKTWQGRIHSLRGSSGATRAERRCARAKMQDESWTPLHFAAGAGNVDAARHFLADGHQVDAQITSGHTPLHLASQMGNLEIAQ